MRSWTYSYKTSDGLRHEAEMTAPNKDAVYDELRKQGIRAIRVEERIAPVVKKGLRGLRRRDWFIVTAVASFFALIISWVVVFIVDNQEVSVVAQRKPSGLLMPVKTSMSKEFNALMSGVEIVLENHRKAADSIDRELLSNYALVERVSDISEFRMVIAKGREVVADTRAQVRDLFAKHYGLLSQNNEDELIQAQRAYGMAMETIDMTEERLDADECAIEILDSNRGIWRVKKGEVVWDDPQLEALFKMYCRDDIQGTSRWQKDFGSAKKVLSSSVIEVHREDGEAKIIEIPSCAEPR